MWTFRLLYNASSRLAGGCRPVAVLHVNRDGDQVELSHEEYGVHNEDRQPASSWMVPWLPALGVWAVAWYRASEDQRILHN